MRRSEPDDLCGSEIKGDRKRGMFTMYEIGEICFGGYLCVVSMWDIRKREIPVWLIAAGGILSASLGYFHGKIPLVLMVTGALVGGVFLLISRLTQEAFGYGDSLMIAVTGVYLGFWNVIPDDERYVRHPEISGKQQCHSDDRPRQADLHLHRLRCA